MKNAYYISWVSPKGAKSAIKYREDAMLRFLKKIAETGVTVHVRKVLVPA